MEEISEHEFKQKPNISVYNLQVYFPTVQNSISCFENAKLN
jgi:hypothetical protein